MTEKQQATRVFRKVNIALLEHCEFYCLQNGYIKPFGLIKLTLSVELFRKELKLEFLL